MKVLICKQGKRGRGGRFSARVGTVDGVPLQLELNGSTLPRDEQQSTSLANGGVREIVLDPRSVEFGNGLF